MSYVNQESLKCLFLETKNVRKVIIFLTIVENLINTTTKKFIFLNCFYKLSKNNSL